MDDIVKDLEALARKWHDGQFRKGPEHLPEERNGLTLVVGFEWWGCR